MVATAGSLADVWLAYRQFFVLLQGVALAVYLIGIVCAGVNLLAGGLELQ